MDRPWMTPIGMLFAKQSSIEGSEWEDLYEHCKEMSKAAGVRNSNESQKCNGPLEDGCGNRQWRGFFMTTSAKTTLWEEQKRDWNTGMSISKTKP